MEGQKQIRKQPRLWFALLKYFKWIVMSYGILFLAEVGSVTTVSNTNDGINLVGVCGQILYPRVLINDKWVLIISNQ